jgi:hypothetical protein
MHTWMPSLCFQRDKPHAEETLIDIEDSGHDSRDGEVFLDKGVVQVERLLDELAVVISVVPDVEFAVEWISFLRMLFLLQCK